MSFAYCGYGLGTHAPGRCSRYIGKHCEEVGGGGDSMTEPYIASYHAILAHATAVQTYREKY